MSGTAEQVAQSPDGRRSHSSHDFKQSSLAAGLAARLGSTAWSPARRRSRILALPAKTRLARPRGDLKGGWACVLDRDASDRINFTRPRTDGLDQSMAEEARRRPGVRPCSCSCTIASDGLRRAGGQLLGEALGGADTWSRRPRSLPHRRAGRVLPPATVERLNTVLTAGVVASFCYIVAGGISRVEPELLTRADWSAITPALPVIPVVYVYQTVVPTLCYRLQCDLDSVRRAVLVGLTIPLCMFLAWSVVVLGSTPYVPGDSVDPLALARASGDDFGTAILYFSLLAVGTSLLGFATGLVDFFGDLQGLDGDDRPPYLWAAALVPPAAIAALFGNPSLFFAAVDSPEFTASLCWWVVPAIAWARATAPRPLTPTGRRRSGPWWARLSRRDRWVRGDDHRARGGGRRGWVIPD